MKLYRGDNIYNKLTEPGLYRNNGLRSKAFGGGSDPTNIKLIRFRESIRKHIKWENDLDKEFYDVSDYLSFSEDLERAIFWCRNKDTLTIKNTESYKETRYIFTLNMDDSSLREFGNGIFSYSFMCNPSLKSSDSGIEPHLSTFSYVCNEETCMICNNKLNEHKILLINSFDYLRKCTSPMDICKYRKAIECAEEDKEWLILPLDPIKKYRSCRIPRADFWTAEHYKAIGEKRPDLNYL